MAAAVADFRPRGAGGGQALAARRPAATCTLELTAVPDLLAGLARARQNGRPFLIGFAAELAGGAALEARASGKLREKGCDAIVANDVSAPGIGFDADDNAVTVLFADGGRADIPRASKRAVAERLWGLFASRLAAEGHRRRPEARATSRRRARATCLTRASRATRRKRCATWRRPAA